jgi:putative phage-type endonuclease
MLSFLPSLQALSVVTPSLSTSNGIDTSFLWQQAGKSRKKQILLKQKDEHAENSKNDVSETLPEPLIPWEGIQTVDLVTSDHAASTILARIQLKDTTVQEIDPRDLHQTSDYRLWMMLRDQVDVSASQFSVVLGTNYFTTRESYLQQKIEGINTLEQNQTNAQACAWGIKMEPLAFHTYSQVMGTSHTVTETGMHILKHSVGDKQYLLGASPDGIVTEHGESTAVTTQGLLEIKSLWGRRHNKGLPKFDYCPKRYYDQIQGQLAICDKPWCDLMLFIPGNGDNGGGRGRKPNKRQQQKKTARHKRRLQDTQATGPRRHGQNYSIVRVERDEKYWNETLLPALIEFCNETERGKSCQLC